MSTSKTAAFIVDGIRTPIGSLGGSHAAVRADDLAAHLQRALLERHLALERSRQAEVIMG